jgi:hypothetical protein
MKSDVVSSHAIKRFQQLLEIEGKIQKDVILKHAQPLIIRLHMCAPKEPMRVKTADFTCGQFATFEAASVGIQWQFTDGGALRGVYEKPFVRAGLQVLSNSGTAFRGVLSADHGDLQDELLKERAWPDERASRPRARSAGCAAASSMKPRLNP